MWLKHKHPFFFYIGLVFQIVYISASDINSYAAHATRDTALENNVTVECTVDSLVSSQPTINCSKSTSETAEQCTNSVEN